MTCCNRLVLGMALALSAQLAAQLTDADSRERARLPDPPADHILDVAALYSRFPERRDTTSARLLALQADHDLPVYVVIYGTVIDSTPQRRAQLLHDLWIGPDRDGIVVVFEADTRQCEIVTPGSHFSRPEGEDESLSRLPDHRMIKILASLTVTLDGVEDRLDYLDRTIEILAQQVDALLLEEPTGLGGWPAMHFVVMTFVIGALLGLLGIFTSKRLRLLEVRARERYYFPDVMVGTRLGAPFGGGRQSVVDFSGDHPPPER